MEELEGVSDTGVPALCPAHYPPTSGVVGLPVLRATVGVGHMIVTFGYRHGGPPAGARLVYDVRDLPNPWQDRLLRDRDGTDPLVIAWVTAHGGESRAREIVSAIRRCAEHSMAIRDHVAWDEGEGEPILVAIGCSGGRHRSVVIAQLVATLTGEVVEHRDFSPSPPLTLGVDPHTDNL